MKRTIGTTITAASFCLLALGACGGGGGAGAPTSAAAGSTAPPSAASSVEEAAASVTPSPASTSTSTPKEERDKVFVADVRAKVASGDYTPTKDSSEKSRKNVKEYLAALADDRLAAAGEYNCQIKKEVTEAGVKNFGRRDFEKLELKNTGLEEGYKPLLGLSWDEAVKTICPE